MGPIDHAPRRLAPPLGAALLATLAGCGGQSPSTQVDSPTVAASTAGNQVVGAAVPWPTGGASVPATLPSGPSGSADLRIDLDDGSGHTATWTLTCEPAGGSHPEPARACGVLGAEGGRALEDVPAETVCAQLYGGPQVATISGSWRGVPVSARISREDACQTDRWTALLGLLPPVP